MTATMTEKKKARSGRYFRQDPKTGKFVNLPKDEVPMAQKPICARFPVDVDEKLRSIPNRSDFIRAVVSEAVRGLEQEDEDE